VRSFTKEFCSYSGSIDITAYIRQSCRHRHAWLHATPV